MKKRLPKHEPANYYQDRVQFYWLAEQASIHNFYPTLLLLQGVAPRSHGIQKSPDLAAGASETFSFYRLRLSRERRFSIHVIHTRSTRALLIFLRGFGDQGVAGE